MTDSGVADAYVLSLPSGMEGPEEEYDGMTVRFIALAPNTGACTVDVLGYGAIAIKDGDGSTDPLAGQISNVNVNELMYDGAVWRIISTVAIGGATSPSVRTIAETGHGYVVGDVIRQAAANVTTKAQANNEVNANAIGIVKSINGANEFTLQTNGYITGLPTLVANTLYYLDPTTPGPLTNTKPTTVGQVVKPMLITDTTTSGYILEQRGELITAASVTTNVIVSGDDTTPGDLEAKIAAGTNVTLTTLNPGANEQREINVTPNVEVSANDTTPGDLEAKIVAGTGISLSTLNEGANEQLEISVPGGGALATPKVLVHFTGTTIFKSQGVSSTTDLGTGHRRVNFSTAFADADYMVAGSARGTTSLGALFSVATRLTTSVEITTWDTGSAVLITDFGNITVVCWGDQ
jgi:hypothetical protein